MFDFPDKAEAETGFLRKVDLGKVMGLTFFFDDFGEGCQFYTFWGINIRLFIEVYLKGYNFIRLVKNYTLKGISSEKSMSFQKPRSG